jgi:hypothetical protein
MGTRKAHASASQRAQQYLKDVAHSSNTHRQLLTIKRKLSSLQLIYRASYAFGVVIYCCASKIIVIKRRQETVLT